MGFTGRAALGVSKRFQAIHTPVTTTTAATKNVRNIPAHARADRHALPIRLEYVRLAAGLPSDTLTDSFQIRIAYRSGAWSASFSNAQPSLSRRYRMGPRR